jgi:heme-binding protein
MRPRVRRVLRWIGICAAVLLVVAQAFRPARTNPPFDPARTIQARTHMTPQVAAVLDRSCLDCHSNQTRWPWYSEVAPVSWFLTGHVKEARHRLNFSDWPDKLKVQDANLTMMCQEVRHGDMPLSSYTMMHRGSKPSAEDVQALCDWTDAERERLRSEQAKGGEAGGASPAPAAAPNENQPEGGTHG